MHSCHQVFWLSLWYISKAFSWKHAKQITLPSSLASYNRFPAHIDIVIQKGQEYRQILKLLTKWVLFKCKYFPYSFVI